MKNLLFGWITKPQYLYTFLDSIFAFIEVFIVIFIVYILGCMIRDKIEDFKERNRRK